MRKNRLYKFLDFYAGILLNVVLSFFLKTRRKGEFSNTTPTRILVVKLAALGDAVLLVPSVRALRQQFPTAEIVLFGTTLTEPFLSMFPEYLTSSITVDVGKLLYQPLYFWHTVQKLRSMRFEVAVDFEQWSRITPLLVSLANIPARVGFRTKGQHRHFLYTHPVERNTQAHEVDNFLSLAHVVTGRQSPALLEIRIRDESARGAAGKLRESGWSDNTQLVVLHPGCGKHGYPREWPPEKYRELATRLAQTHQVFFVVTGTVEEVPRMDAVVQSASFPFVRYRIESLSEFIGLLSLSSLVVSGNNGTMHLGAAAQRPQIALHGPTNAKRWGPINPNAVIIESSCPECPCLDLGFEYHRTDGYCMKQIDVEQVLECSGRLLSGALHQHSTE